MSTTGGVIAPATGAIPQRLITAWLDASGIVADLEAELNELTIDNPWRQRLEVWLASERRRLVLLDLQWRRALAGLGTSEAG